MSRRPFPPITFLCLGLGLCLALLMACRNEINFYDEQGGDPACQVLNGDIDFGTIVADGVAFADRTFSLRNIGGGQLTGTIRTDTPGATLLSGGGFYSLTAGQLRRVTIRFRPVAPGNFSGEVQLGHACRAATFHGRAESPQGCSVSPVALDFGTVLTDGTPPDKSFTITNPGPHELTGTITESCDAYSIVTGGGNYTIPVAGSRTVTVRFRPTTAGNQDCLIETGASVCADVTVNGFAENPPVCEVNPSRIDLGLVLIGSFAENSFTIENAGGSRLTGSVGESCPAFSIPAGGGSFDLGAGESRTVTVRFQPTTTGADSCQIALTGVTGCSGPLVVARADQTVQCSISSTNLNFGDVEVNTTSSPQSFTITNIGGQTLTGSVSESCPEFAITSGIGPFSLGAGASRIVTVTLTPTSEGPKSCTIQTGTTDCSNVSATGNGVIRPVCQVSPTDLDFGLVTATGTDFADRSFTITNIGGGILSGTIGESCGFYEITSGGGAFSLTALQSRTVTVRFQPASGSFGPFPCTITTGTPCSVAASGVGAVGFQAHVLPLVSTSCALSGCHNGGNSLPDFRNFATATDPKFVNTIDEPSSLILLKPSNQVSHGGGLISGWGLDQSNYRTTLLWIQQDLRP